MNELITELHSEVIQKQQKINELNDRIDKAIEYINGWLSFPHINCNEIKECQNILKILKGDSNE